MLRWHIYGTVIIPTWYGTLTRHINYTSPTLSLSPPSPLFLSRFLCSFHAYHSMISNFSYYTRRIGFVRINKLLETKDDFSNFKKKIYLIIWSRKKLIIWCFLLKILFYSVFTFGQPCNNLFFLVNRMMD